MCVCVGHDYRRRHRVYPSGGHLMHCYSSGRADPLQHGKVPPNMAILNMGIFSSPKRWDESDSPPPVWVPPCTTDCPDAFRIEFLGPGSESGRWLRNGGSPGFLRAAPICTG